MENKDDGKVNIKIFAPKTGKEFLLATVIAIFVIVGVFAVLFVARPLFINYLYGRTLQKKGADDSLLVPPFFVTAGQKIYRNEKFGLEIKYPESQGWQVISEGPEIIFRTSTESQDTGDYWFSISMKINQSDIRNAESWVNNFYRGIESYSSYQQERVEINGSPAFRLRYEGTEQSPASTTTYILRYDKVYEFTCLTTHYLDQSDGICDAMLKTVNFLEI